MTPEILLLPPPADEEGPSMARYARELYAALTCLSGGARGISLELCTAPRYLSRVVNHPHSRRVDRALYRYVAYPRAVRHRRADLFHILDHGYAHVIRALDPGRTVVTCHDLIPLLAVEGVIAMALPATVARTFRWRIGHLRRARAVIAVSEATRAALERYAGVPSDRITVIPQGVAPLFGPLRDCGRATRAEAGLDDTHAVLLQVASRSRYKNTPAALHALARLRATRGDRIVLARVGASMFPDETDLAVRLGVVNAVHEVGTVDDATLIAWYNAADVLIFPSLWEGFGWPPLEAMACGTPVVASTTPAVAEVVGDAGLLAPPEDPDALAASVEHVLADRALAESLRQKGLARARQFTWARTAAATMAVYNRVLE